jgi:hypothetical protein
MGLYVILEAAFTIALLGVLLYKLRISVKDIITISMSDNILKNTYKKKALNMPKGQDEPVNGRKDNTMSKRKWTKGQTMIYKTLHRKLKIEQREPAQKRG